jgi:hypothetical protein
MAKEGEREELADSLNSSRNMRPSSSSPKSSSKQGINTAPSSTIALTPESQSPPMNAVSWRVSPEHRVVENRVQRRRVGSAGGPGPWRLKTRP